jgi:CheY-like chemotaxis protein
MTVDKPPLILIVDDDYDFLEINRMILERAGYRVVTASEPGEALAKMESEKPDLVITDLMMTDLDSGFSFSRTIKVDPRFTDLPVIISTSVSSALGLDFRPRSSDEMSQMNVDAYFDKPLDARQLLGKVAELLAARRNAAAAHATPAADGTTGAGTAGDAGASDEAAATGESSQAGTTMPKDD